MACDMRSSRSDLGVSTIACVRVEVGVSGLTY
jgi:hypothetical protein